MGDIAWKMFESDWVSDANDKIQFYNSKTVMFQVYSTRPIPSTPIIHHHDHVLSRLAFTYSKVTTETVEHGVKYVQS